MIPGRVARHQNRWYNTNPEEFLTQFGKGCYSCLSIIAMCIFKEKGE
jgi:hypothetical protein